MSEQNNHQSLDDYLATCFKNNVIDHSLRANVDDHGRISFYIHPASIDGNTLDFWIWDNCLWDKYGVHPEEISKTMLECAKEPPQPAQGETEYQGAKHYNLVIAELQAQLAAKEDEIAGFVKHVGASSFQDAVGVLLRTKQHDEEKIEKMFNQIKATGAELAATRRELEAFKEADPKKLKEKNYYRDELAQLRKELEEANKRSEDRKKEILIRDGELQATEQLVSQWKALAVELGAALECACDIDLSSNPSKRPPIKAALAKLEQMGGGE